MSDSTAQGAPAPHPAALPIRITPESVLRELQRVTENLTRGS
jgi:hypothetical protein